MQYQVDVDANGSWSLDIFDEFEIGPHALTASDNFGNEDLAIFHIKGKESFEAAEIKEVDVRQFNVLQIPGQWTLPLAIGGILFLLLLIAVFVAEFGFAKQIHKKKHETHKRTLKLAKKIMGVAAVLITILGILAVGIGYQFGKFTKKSKVDLIIQDEEIVQVSGIIRNPFSLESDEQIKLIVGDVEINTVVGGAFNFTEVGLESGIGIEHATFAKGIVYVPPTEGNIDILYDTDLYNKLITLITAQSKGEVEEIGNHIDPSLQDVDVVKAYVAMPAIYKRADMVSDKVTIINVDQISEYESVLKDAVFTNVIRITTINRGVIGAYNFVYIDDEWRYVL